MTEPPIPVRIPSLVWRAPVFLWMPAALALSIAWPAALFPSNPDLRHLALVGGASVFALAMTGLALRWVIRGAPKARRVIVRHIVVWGAIASILAPFILAKATGSAALVGDLSFGAIVSMLPLSLLLGLPASLVSGSIFALLALRRPLAR